MLFRSLCCKSCGVEMENTRAEIEGMEEVVFRRLQTEKLHKAINELPEQQKKRLILHYFQELTYVEIAEREKCSTRAVEYSIHGAIQSLKKFFEKN